MSYVIPSVLVYQQLAGSGGVANISPDLDACIIGPCINSVKYDQSTSATLAVSRAKDENGADAVLTGNGGPLDAYLSSVKIGQVVDEASILLYVNKAQVHTKTGRCTVAANNNLYTVGSMSGFTATTTLNSKVLVFDAAPTTLYLNDYLTVAGAGVGGATLEGYVTAISGVNVTISAAAKTVVVGATITRTGIYNKNDLTSTALISVGDLVEIDLDGPDIQFTTVLSISAVGDKITSLRTADVLPPGQTGGLSRTLKFRKVMNDLFVPKVYGAVTNYNTDNAASDGYVGLLAGMTCIYGEVDYGDVYLEYKALRLDLSGSILDIADVNDQIGRLGKASEDNPLGLGVNLALANTTGRIRAIAVQSDDLTGYLQALELAENARLYALAPLTQSIDILSAFQQHVEQMSTPEFASWRMALINTAIPAVQDIGIYNSDLANGPATVTLQSGKYILLMGNATFVSDGVVPGDIVHRLDGTKYVISGVKSNQELEVVGPTSDQTNVNYWVERNLSKVQQAEVVAAQSTTFASNRVVHVQPDLVGVILDGVTRYLPGYYACCALAGLISGLPAQKGLTNIGLAGIADLTRSNFYFTRAQLDTMAEAGTLLLVQEAQGTLPYVRHSLTTDMTVLQYREIQQVKNIDFVSYFFYDILKGFPGRYNITPDTLQILRTTINAAGKLLQGKPLPKIGPPLLSFTIKTLKQDEANRDHVIIELPITIPTVMNYVNLYLIV